MFSIVETTPAIEFRGFQGMRMRHGATVGDDILSTPRKELGEDIHQRGLERWKTGAYNSCVGLDRGPDGGDQGSVRLIGIFRG